MSCAAIIFVSLLTTAVGSSASAAAAPATPAVPPTPAQTQTRSQAEAQSGAPQSDTLPVSLDHIRKALDETNAAAAAAPDAPKLRVNTGNLPVFRTRTTSGDVPISSVYDDGSGVRAYIRPATTLYDYEFKQMVTPDAVKGCGRLTSSECLQSYANQFLTGLIWQRATQRKKTAGTDSQP